MKGSETKLITFMQGSDKRFVIPVYQRNYDWKIENCKQLYEDLIRIIKNERKSHFFGSIVSVINPDGEYNEFQIIDGQQRITTISLLFLAIYNLLKSKKIKSQKNNLAEKILKTYLVDEWQENGIGEKLKSVKNDKEAYLKLFGEETEFIDNSNITINYKFFYERIQKEEINVDELFDAITKLEIIHIKLNQDDNPQLIFESLNSTGLALSEGDKIRNLILMGLPTKLQNRYYENYWNKIEIYTNYNVSAFIRDYLSIKLQKTPAFSKIYITFKKFKLDYYSDKVTTEDLLAELSFYAKIYGILLNGGTGNKRLNGCISRLNRLETTVTRPFFLEVLRMNVEKKLSLDEVADIFTITENYLFRRSICDLPTNNLNKIYLLLHKEITKYDGTEENYIEKYKYNLLSKKDRSRFPNDEEFINSFSNKEVYGLNSKNKIYILERFENFGTYEDKDVYRHFDNGEYTIEHIMPQHLTPVWVKDLGEDYKKIHSVWLHRLANLTLTAYNSKYSNSSFEEKKNIANGFSESGIRLNQIIAQNEKWTLSELEKRNDYLMKKALEIWELPNSLYKPYTKQMDSFSLEDDIDYLIGKNIVKFSYKNIEQPVRSWSDMFENIINILYTENKYIIQNIAKSQNNAELSTYFSFDKNLLRRAGELDSGLYFEKNSSTWLKASILRRLFSLYDIDYGDLIFYVKESVSKIGE